MRVGVLATMVFATLIGYPIASFAGLAPDADSDGIPDVLDKCTLDSRNTTATCDTDVDGYGNPCDADFDQNFSVNGTDFISIQRYSIFRTNSLEPIGPASLRNARRVI